MGIIVTPTYSTESLPEKVVRDVEVTGSVLVSVNRSAVTVVPKMLSSVV